MLTEKDYCDYETCVALKKLGYPCDTIQMKNCNKEKEPELFICRPHLYNAQKWLREYKNIIVEAGFNLMYKGQPRFNWSVLYNLTQHKGAYYTLDSVRSKEDYDSFEEALSEGVKCAVKILKENETIYR